MKRTRLLNIISSVLIGVIFMIAMLLVMIFSGVINLQRTDLVFSTGSASAVYDGKPLTNHRWELKSGTLKAGHKAVVTFTGEQTSAGESDNTIQVKIIDAAKADVTGDYNISYELGTLKVTPKAVTVKSFGASKIYDGIPLINSEYEVSSLVSGHKAVVVVTGTQKEVGFSPNTIQVVSIMDRAGKDVTNNYQITKTEGPLVVTDKNGGGTNFGDNSEYIDPEELKNIIIYRVYSNKDGKIYLKTKSYGNYTGGGFGEAENYDVLLNSKYSAAYLTSFALQAKNAEWGEVTIQRGENGAYALPYYIMGNVAPGYNIQTNDVESEGDATQYTVNYYLHNMALSAHNSYIYRSFEETYRQFVHNNYLAIDSETLNYMNNIISREGFKASDIDIIAAVSAFIQSSAEYNMEYNRELDKETNIAVAFLENYKEGVCRHYAMAATMLYRALGIPARYTIGAVADAKAGEWVDVNALQSHAWVEVYIDGIGWQMVEVTGGTSAGGSGEGGSGEGGVGEGGVDFENAGSSLSPEELMNIILYKVYATHSGPVYLKSTSYGDYTGNGFKAAKEYTSLLYGQYSASYLTSFALQTSGATDARIEIEDVSGNGYVLPYYFAEYINNGYAIQGSDVKVNGSASVYTVDYFLYDVTPTAHTINTRKVFEENYRAFVYDQYTKIDDETKNFLLNIANEEGISASDADVIAKIAEFIQNSAEYDMAYDQALDKEENIALAFLGNYKKGVCRHYAMAATMLYRALGIPARYTVGVLANAEAEKTVEVNALQAHAWVEVYIDGIGWQMVEVTGGSFGGGGSGSGGSGSGSGSGGSGEGDSGEGGSGSGGVGAGGIDFSVGNAPLSPDELNKIIYRVYSTHSGPIYLKGSSYGDYTGNGFKAAEEYTSLLYGQYSASYLTSFALQAAGAASAAIQIEDVAGYGYVLPYYFTEHINNGYEIQESDVKSNGNANIYNLDYYLNNVTPSAHTIYTVMQYEANYRLFVYDKYTVIDEETRSYMLDFANKAGISVTDDNVIDKIATLIKESAEYNMQYDRGLDAEENIAVEFLENYKEGICRHYAMAATMLYRALGFPARYTVGVLAEAEANKTVDVKALQAHAWVEVYIDGIGWRMVEVTGGNEPGDSGDVDEPVAKPDKYITPISVYMRYDGTTAYAVPQLKGFTQNANNGYWYNDEGYWYKAEELKIEGSRTYVGIGSSTITDVVIYNSEGKDVTDEFICNTGKIHVYYWEISVSSNSLSYYYGESGERYTEITGEGIQPGHRCEILFKNVTNAGSHLNSFDIVIKDENGDDVTEQYKITRNYGSLKINRITLTVTAGSATQAYNGTPLTSNDFSYEGTLAEGDVIFECVTEGSQTNIGRSDNVISHFTIHNAYGEDVTKNYNVKMVKGMLRVTRN